MRELTGSLLRGAVILAAVLLLLTAGEQHFRPEQTRIAALAVPLGAGVALALLVFHHLYWRDRERQERYRLRLQEREDEIAGLQGQVRALEHRRRQLSEQIEALTAHRNLARAATSYTSLEEFLDETARLARDNSGARDLVVFLRSGARETPTPHAYYHLCGATELCLHFTGGGGIVLAEEMDRYAPRTGVLDAEMLRARKLQVFAQGAHVAVTAELTYRGAAVGSLRLALLHIEPEAMPEKAVLRKLVMGELGNVRLDNGGLTDVLERRRAVRYDSRRHVMELACPLGGEADAPGVIKMGFDHDRTVDPERLVEERRQILATTAAHVTQILRHEKLYEQATRDGLTGLFNKRHMLGAMENFIRVAARHGSHLSLILLDIDHFKKVNDTYGHLTGDIILRDVGAILRDSVRECDMACRYGGEELAVLLPEGGLEGSVGLAERIRARIEKHDFVGENGETLKITTSLGVAAFREGMERPEQLIADADAVLYEAKHGGRNRVIVAQPAAAKPSSRTSHRFRPPRRQHSVRL